MRQTKAQSIHTSSNAICAPNPMNFAVSLKERLCIVALFLVAATTARADNFCATSSAQLQTALNTAATNGQNDTIRIEQGTYVPANSSGFTATITDGKYISLIGGFGRGPMNTYCGGAQLHGSGATILDGAPGTGANNFRLLNIHAQGVSAARISLFSLTFVHGKGEGTEPVLKIDGDSAWGGDVFLENISMKDNEIDDSLVRIATAGRIFLLGSEFVNNHGMNSSSFALDLITNGGPDASAAIYFNNNTLAKNDVPGSNDSMLVAIHSTRDARIANSIIVSNNDNDLYFDGPHIYVDNSVARSHFQTGGADSITETNPFVILPTFVSPTDFHLLAPSAFIDGGAANPLGGPGSFDIAGNPRTVGVLDVGAYESQDSVDDVIFYNDFEVSIVPLQPLYSGDL